jgi:hypothetical protein
MARKNPYFREGKWWFFDETEDVYGPFETEQDAKESLDHYINFYLKGRQD